MEDSVLVSIRCATASSSIGKFPIYVLRFLLISKHFPHSTQCLVRTKECTLFKVSVLTEFLIKSCVRHGVQHLRDPTY